MSSLEHLRALVFNDPDPAQSPYLSALLQAESRTERSVAESGRGDVPRAWVAPTAPPSGILWETAASERAARVRTPSGQVAGLRVSARLRMAHVPTSVVHLFDVGSQPLVTLRVENNGSEPSRLRLRARVEGFSAQAVETITVETGGQSEVSLLPTFFPDRIASFSEICRATLHLCIDDLDGKTEQERTVPIWLLPRSSALLYVQDPATKTRQDLTPYLAAYVTPNVPAILDLLRSAAGHIASGSVSSYQVGAQGVLEQVGALYQALRERGLTYVNSVLLSGAIPGVLGQRIRLPRESLAQRSANCIDGVVLLASALEAASLNPALVLVPGHALLGWETGEGSGEWDFLETTLLGRADFEPALKSGRSLAERYRGEVASGSPHKFRLLSLRELRAQGVWPME